MFCGDTYAIDGTYMFSPPVPCPRCEDQSHSLEQLLVSRSTVFVSSNYSTYAAIRVGSPFTTGLRSRLSGCKSNRRKTSTI